MTVLIVRRLCGASPDRMFARLAPPEKSRPGTSLETVSGLRRARRRTTLRSKKSLSSIAGSDVIAVVTTVSPTATTTAPKLSTSPRESRALRSMSVAAEVSQVTTSRSAGRRRRDAPRPASRSASRDGAGVMVGEADIRASVGTVGHRVVGAR
jgi:hypothetical protein